MRIFSQLRKIEIFKYQPISKHTGNLNLVSINPNKDHFSYDQLTCKNLVTIKNKINQKRYSFDKVILMLLIIG